MLDDVRDDVRGLVLIFIMISVTKRMEAAEANVCCGGLQNDSEELRVICRAMVVAFRVAREI